MPRLTDQIRYTPGCETHHKYTQISSIFVLFLALVLGPLSAHGESSPWEVTAILTESVSGQRYRSIIELAEDRFARELYILDNGRRMIDVIDSTGLPRFSFVHWVNDPATGKRGPGEPHALAVSPEGEIFITDFYSRTVDVLNIRGERVGEIDVLGMIGWDEPSLRPEKLALDDAGRLYVSITGSRTGVVRCATDGSACELLVNAGIEGVDAITGMSVAPDGRFAILDYRGEPAVRVYDERGRSIVAFGGHDIAQGDLSYPTDFLFAEDGSYWVADALRHAVKHYDAHGEFLEFIGGYGGGIGSVRFPTAIAGDGVGRLIVSERVGGRIQEYVLPGAVYATRAGGSAKISAVSAAPESNESK
ncbi:MAG: NHL repeat-containing protein [Candidatus Zixiibacteriota bacterium]